MVYGDVWVCSGQSNMRWNMGSIFNASEEIINMKNYPGIRMYQVKMMQSQNPQGTIHILRRHGLGGWVQKRHFSLDPVYCKKQQKKGS